jgi:hypothetical protein
LAAVKILDGDVDNTCTARADWTIRMDDPQAHNDTSAGSARLLELENELQSPELDALRDARKRAADARIAAENALIQANAAEAKIIAEEALATAAAAAARHAQLVDAARLAAEREREAQEQLSQIEVQLEESRRTRDEIQTESNRLAQALDEAKRALESLVAADADQAQRGESAAATARQLETERLAALERAEGATQLRGRAEAAVVHTPLPQQIAAPTAAQTGAVWGVPEPGLYQPVDAFDLSTVRAQRAAERRAADAARAASA